MSAPKEPGVERTHGNRGAILADDKIERLWNLADKLETLGEEYPAALDAIEDVVDDWLESLGIS